MSNSYKHLSASHVSITVFLKVVNSENLQAVADASKQACILAIAAYFPSIDGDKVRLIDNLFMSPKGSKFH